IIAAAPSPDGQLLRTLEFDGTLNEWNLQPPNVPAPVAAVENPGPAGMSLPYPARFGYAVSRGGLFAACVQRVPGEKPWTVRVWDLAGNRSATFEARPFKTTTFSSGGQGLLLSADGKRVALSRFVPRVQGGFGQFDPKQEPSPSDLTVWEW